MNTTIQLRIDKKTKKRAQKTFESLGMDLSTGVKIFLAQVVKTQSIPFEIRTANGFTPRQEREIIREAHLALKHGKRYESVNELFKDLNK